MNNQDRGLELGKDSKSQLLRGKNYLLVIAINNYQYFSKLNNAVRDAKDLIDVLTTRYTFERKYVELITDRDATKQKIEAALDQYISTITGQDNLIIYFSGHGLYDKNRGGYWIPVEAQINASWNNYISNNFIEHSLKNINSLHTFLIVDACFSGSLFSHKNKNGLDIDPKETLSSRWGLTAGKNEIVSDGEPGKNSPFATALLQVLRGADKSIGVCNICNLVQDKLASVTDQTPIWSSLNLDKHRGGQLVLHLRKEKGTSWKPVLNADIPKEYSKAIISLKDKPEILHKKKQLTIKLDTEVIPSSFSASSPTSSLSNSTHMVLVKGGSFLLGGNNLHPVILHDFWIAKYQLTFEEYKKYCVEMKRKLPKDEGWGKGKRPVINITWYDAVNYCNWRSQKEELEPVYKLIGEQVTANWKANGYRLPTEAEWEYAARGGEKSQNYMYSGGNNIDKVAIYRENSLNETEAVGDKRANELGIYDMSGNVWEWCWDWYGDFPTGIQTNPKGLETGAKKVIRGGSWSSYLILMSVFARNRYAPSKKINDIGFRLARKAG